MIGYDIVNTSKQRIGHAILFCIENVSKDKVGQAQRAAGDRSG